MSDPANPPTELKPLPDPPTNFARLAALPGRDRVRVQLRINFDVTHLSEDGQKLLLHYMMQALLEFEGKIKRMNKIEVASKLGALERAKATKNNGN